MATTKPRASQIRGLARQNAPFMRSITPAALQPNTTNILTVEGEFFDNYTTVDFQGETTNFVNFVSTRVLEVGITTGNVEGSKFVTINNGLESIFPNRFLNSLGTVVIPDAQDFYNLNTYADVSQAKVEVNQPGGSNYFALADVFTIPTDEDFQIRYRNYQNRFYENQSVTFGQQRLTIIDTITEEAIFNFSYESSGTTNWIRIMDNSYPLNQQSYHNGRLSQINNTLGKEIILERVGTVYNAKESGNQNIIASFDYGNNTNPVKVQVKTFKSTFEDIKKIIL